MQRKWWIVILGCMTHATNTGLAYFGLSAFFPSFEREFGWTRTAISGAFSLARIESGLLGPIEGYFIDRVGPRRMMYVGICLCVIGFIALSFVNSLSTLYASIVLGIVLGSSLGYHMPISLLIARMFRERRSLAFGIFRSGPGISGVMVPFVGWIIGLWGWRTAALVSAALLFLTGVPIAYAINRIVQREEAERGEAADAAHGASAPRHGVDPQFSLGEVLRLRAFWFLSVGMALRHLVTEGVSVHFVILLVDRGWSTAAASTLLGLSAFIGVPARLGAGWLGDLVDKRKLIMAMLLALSGSVVFMGVPGHALLFTGCTIVYSLAYGGLAATQEAIRADYFGTKAFATIQGVSRTITTIGTFMGPLIAGYVHDTTKSYAIAFSIFACSALLSTLFMFLAKKPQPTANRQ
jgi:MFS family permease